MKIQDIKQFLLEHWQHPEIKYPIITAVVVSGLYMMGASWIFSAVTLGIIYSVPLIRFLHEFSSNTLDILHNVNTTTEHASDVAKEAKKTVKAVRKEALGEVGRNLDNITYPWALPGRFLKYAGSWFSGTPQVPANSQVAPDTEETPAATPRSSFSADDFVENYYSMDDATALYGLGATAVNGVKSNLSWLWNKMRGQGQQAIPEAPAVTARRTKQTARRRSAN